MILRASAIDGVDAKASDGCLSKITYCKTAWATSQLLGLQGLHATMRALRYYASRRWYRQRDVIWTTITCKPASDGSEYPHTCIYIHLKWKSICLGQPCTLADVDIIIPVSNMLTSICILNHIHVLLIWGQISIITYLSRYMTSSVLDLLSHKIDIERVPLLSIDHDKWLVAITI